VDVQPEAIERPEPRYPPEAVRRRIQGTVVLRVLVGANGRVEDTQILSGASNDATLQEAAKAAVRRYLFKPAQKGGKAVACWTNVGVMFQLPR
jgi:protein TonB